MANIIPAKSGKNGVVQPRLTYVRSEEMHDILTAPPSWMTRWGSTVIFVIIGQLLFIAYFVKYPDIVKSTIVLTSSTPSVSIMSQAAGKIKLLVKDNQWVNQGTLLGYIENAANFENVQAVKKDIKKLKEGSLLAEFYESSFAETELSLGELQPTFSSVVKSIRKLEAFETINYTNKSIAETQGLISLYNNLQKNIKNQINISVQESELLQKRHRIDSTLYKESIMSEADYTTSKVNLLPANRKIEDYSQALMNNTIKVKELSSKIADMSILNQEKFMALKNEFSQSLDLLEANIAQWEEKYLFKAPVSGSISLFKFQSDFQHITIGENILSIVPTATEMFGSVHLAMANSGKVKIGQVTHIKFKNYPYEQFGMVTGKVSAISTVPQNGLYAVKIALNDGLLTTHNQKLEFKDQMDGTAEIVTEDLRLLERLFIQFSKIFK